MKKLATALCLMAFLGSAPGAFAYMQAEEISTVPTLRSLGFSESATKVTELVRSMSNEPGTETYYDLDPYGNCANKSTRWYTAIKRWFDPLQDDGLFGRHEISFENKWVEDAPDFIGDNKPVYPGVNKSADNANKGSLFKNVGHKAAKAQEQVQAEAQTVQEAVKETVQEATPEAPKVEIIIEEKVEAL